MTTYDYLARELRRVRLSLHRAKKKPNTPESKMQGMRDKIAYLTEALDAVQVHDMAGKPLTLEQLRKMHKENCRIGLHVILHINGIECEGVVDNRLDDGVCAVFSASGQWLKEKDYGKTWEAYAYTTQHIYRDVWEPCESCKKKNCENCKYGYDTTGENEHCEKCIKAVNKMRLIDADNLGVGKANPDTFERKDYANGWNSALQAITEAAPTVDPETFPVVRQLREELALVTAERDSAVKDIETVMSYEYADDIWRFLCSICQNKLPAGECKCTGTVCIPKWAGIRKDK